MVLTDAGQEKNRPNFLQRGTQIIYCAAKYHLTLRKIYENYLKFPKKNAGTFVNSKKRRINASRRVPFKSEAVKK